jgi:hypothetical protein
LKEVPFQIEYSDPPEDGKQLALMYLLKNVVRANSDTPCCLAASSASSATRVAMGAELLGPRRVETDGAAEVKLAHRTGAWFSLISLDQTLKAG